MIRLKRIRRTCECGQSGGRYLDDVNAIYFGPCVPLGFANHSLAAAVKAQPSAGAGLEFRAFVIPKACDTMHRKDDEADLMDKAVHKAHVTHCCGFHGCKYGQRDICPVVQGKAAQIGPCEECGLELEGFYGEDEQRRASKHWPADVRAQGSS